MFYAIGNIGDSKKTDGTRLTDVDDKYECCIEIMDVGRTLSAFPADTMMNAMTQDPDTGEYIWAKNENLGILCEKVNGNYVPTSDKTVNYNKTYYVDILEHDDFSEDYTYGWRYVYEDGTDEENKEASKYCHNKWKEFYKFVTTSTDEEFKTKLSDYFVIDSALYYYLFTTRYCLVDNRAKNSFWHYGKTGEVDSEGNPIRKWDLTWGYDMDTALGLNNYGVQVYRYGYEDIDVDEDGAEVFRQSDSKFFCRIRDIFASELQTLYGTLESNNAWHAESFINKADEWQSEFPEELWRLDIERKYIRTYTTSYINGTANADFLNNMANGKMKYHRRQWERNQEKYMCSKYKTTTALNESIVIRCGKPTEEDKENFVVPQSYTLKLIPYAYMYLNVSYGATNPVSVRAKPGIEYEINSTVKDADIINIWSASNLQSIGDLSACYAATVDISQASKLKELTIGNSTEGYDNSYFVGLTVGANYLLEKINVENVSKLTEPINGLNLLSNLKELYAHGSNLSGVTFADGGKIEIAELPAIGSITMKNLMYLISLDITDLSKLTKITVENCNTIDLLTILNNAPNLNRARITNIDWVLDNGKEGTNDEREVPLLNRLYNMKGSDKDDYLLDRAVLTGKVQVPTIREQRLREYQEAWSELEITASTIHEQFAVTFVNDDGTVLEVQYVDKGDNATDPTTREDSPFTPTKESTPTYYYEFAGWDTSLNIILAPRTITATYTEHLRTYTVSYYAKGKSGTFEQIYSGSGLVGENIPYDGDIPTYTSEESTYTFYLFNRWDKSGIIGTEDKRVEAIYDSFTYTGSEFDDKDFSDMTPVEIYALCKLNKMKILSITDFVDYKDALNIRIGNDITYDDIEQKEFITEATVFDGTNNIDTGVSLFDENRDFTLAIDYEFTSGCLANGVLAQCLQPITSGGFKLWYNASPRVTYDGTLQTGFSGVGYREIVILRHQKSDDSLTVYYSNISGDVKTYTLSAMEKEVFTNTLVFGSAKLNDGSYSDYAMGKIYWAKLWYCDLGETTCQSIASWIHEDLTMEVANFNTYPLSEDYNVNCSVTLLASTVLGRGIYWNKTNTTTGGWRDSYLRSYMNGRIYNSIPIQIRSIIKNVYLKGGAGDNDATVANMTYSEDYIHAPSYRELYGPITGSSTLISPYNDETGSGIPWMTSYTYRRKTDGSDTYRSYWTRTPYVYTYSSTSNRYVTYIDTSGYINNYYRTPMNSYYMLIEFSF